MFDFEINSPEEQVVFSGISQYNIKLSIKRDDLIHPFISGNKWRKLKYNLIKAQSSAKTHLVTFGGAFSNHLLATAAAGAKFKFKTTAFVRGEEADNQVLDLCKLFGMHLIFVSREAYKNKEQLFEKYFKDDNSSYYIEEGGFGLEAELGCREIISELKQNYNHIFCSAGTGATAAGIINGNFKESKQSEIHIVPALKGGLALKSEIDSLLIHETPYHIHDEYHFGGYAKIQASLIDFIKNFVRETGIMIDPVYTAKTLFAIQDLASKNYFAPNATILMIHTGGLFGILGMLDRFQLD